MCIESIKKYVIRIFIIHEIGIYDLHKNFMF